MAVDSYTNRNLPLMEGGTGGWASAINGIIEWLDAEMSKAQNIVIKDGLVVTKNSDVVYKQVLGSVTG